MPIDRTDQGASASDMGAKLAHLVNSGAIVANHLPDDAAADTFVASLDPARDAIAMAEELLAALKWARGMANEAILLRADSDDPADHECLELHREALAECDAAIAKATGA